MPTYCISPEKHRSLTSNYLSHKRFVSLEGKEVIIVHDSHGGGGGGGAEYGAGTAAGWVSGHTATGWSTGGGADSYSAGSHIGGGDNTYAGAQDSYSSGK